MNCKISKYLLRCQKNTFPCFYMCAYSIHISYESFAKLDDIFFYTTRIYIFIVILFSIFITYPKPKLLELTWASYQLVKLLFLISCYYRAYFHIGKLLLYDERK